MICTLPCDILLDPGHVNICSITHEKRIDTVVENINANVKTVFIKLTYKY
jgi:hypothetical protein